MKFYRILLILSVAVTTAGSGYAQSTINETNKYAYTTNAGWINFRPDQPSSPNGVVIGEAFLSGYAYAANVGWINFGNGAPANGHAYQNNSATDFGVNHDGAGNLTGMAYGANIGWINFGWAGETDSLRPRFDLITGRFVGYAYGANIGWVKLGTTFLTTDTMLCIDSDGDGMDDAWEYQHFGNLNAANTTTDTDGDGQGDQAEYQARTDPDNESESLEIVSHVLNVDATLMDLEFTSTPSRLYVLEICDDMKAPWEDSGLGIFSPDSGLLTAKTLTFPEGSERKFIRVRPIKPLQP